MDSRYLKSLIAVIDRGSIADAARAEGLTAAAVGQRVQALERELNVVLLSRAGHAALPTAACLSLLPRARRIVSEMGLLRNDSRDEALRGTLRVGAISTALTGLLPETLRRLTALAPGIRPVIVPGTSRDLYKALQSRDLDAAIMASPPFALPASMRCDVLQLEPLVFIANAKITGEVDVLLRTLPYIRYDPQAWGGRHAMQYLDERGLFPTVLCDLDALETIAMLVADGMGVSLVPRWSGFERWAANCKVTPIVVETVDGVSRARNSDMRYARELVVLSERYPERPDLLDALFQALARK